MFVSTSDLLNIAFMDMVIIVLMNIGFYIEDLKLADEKTKHLKKSCNPT